MAAAMDVRSRVLEEIVATERTFVESLRTCIAVFHAPLEAAVGSRCEDVDGPLGRLLKELALLEPLALTGLSSRLATNSSTMSTSAISESSSAPFSSHHFRATATSKPPLGPRPSRSSLR